jgi:hypothetical protein
MNLSPLPVLLINSEPTAPLSDIVNDKTLGKWRAQRRDMA